MNQGLANQVVLVTGGARGMGAEHAEELVALGAKVVVADVLEREGRALVDKIGQGAVFAHLDVTDADAWKRAIALTEDTFGPVRHLVNNAGVLTYGSLESLDERAFRRTIDVNLTGAWLGMRAALPSLRRAGGGSIVNVASTAGLIGYAHFGAYVASKWGLRGLTKTAALELSREGIRVNLLHPGPIRTPMIEGLDAHLVDTQPIDRIGEPHEVTAMLIFLLTEATYSTGCEFVIDGGATLGQLETRATQPG
jgi:3alpha(or 20beta)-hydroxysteroid dehydrogenase